MFFLKRAHKNNNKKIVLFFWIQIVVILAIALLLNVDVEELSYARIFSIAFDIAGIIVGEVILICSLIVRDDSKDEVLFFSSLLIITMIEMFLDELAWITDGKKEFYDYAMGINTAYYMFAQLLGFIFWYYVLYMTRQKAKMSKRIKMVSRFVDIGLFIVLVIILLNYHFGYIFSIDKHGVYQRGDYNAISYYYPYIVVGISFIEIIRNRKKVDIHQFIALLFYVIVPVSVSFTLMFFYECSFLYPSIMASILLMYCMNNITKSKRAATAEYDLNLAAKIQKDALPKEFPAFPNRNEFDLYAYMSPARNIGGDFYDFFMIDDDKLAICIADVSGKGMPAALFMMAAKNLIKSVCRIKRDSPAEILEAVNRQLCDGNEESFFITVCFGVLTISSGELVYANAGHEYPAVCRKGASFKLRKADHTLPLAIDKDIQFINNSIKLNKGDTVYIFTDGVTDARNEDGVLFGEKRLLDALNREPASSVQKIIENVLDAISGFSRGAARHDDITMLSLRYNGSFSIDKFEADNVTSLKVDATLENWDVVMKMIKDRLDFYGCSRGTANQIFIAAEEIYVNIARYAYQDRVGYAVVITDFDEETKAFSIRFIDAGVMYNPLKREDPNINLSVNQRRIGGLGIYMVKKIMDQVSYEHKGGNNIFVMKKIIK